MKYRVTLYLFLIAFTVVCNSTDTSLENTQKLIPLNEGNYWVYETAIKINGDFAEIQFDTIRIDEKVLYSKDLSGSGTESFIAWKINTSLNSRFVFGEEIGLIGSDTVVSSRPYPIQPFFIHEFIAPKTTDTLSYTFLYGGDTGGIRKSNLEMNSTCDEDCYTISGNIYEDQRMTFLIERGIGIKNYKRLTIRDSLLVESVKSQLIEYKIN